MVTRSPEPLRVGRWLAVLLLWALAGTAVAAAKNIYAESWLSNPAPFVKEPLLYTVRVYSSIDLRTLQIVPPTVNDATLERVDEKNLTGNVTLDGTRYVTSDIRYILTPLRPGGLHIGPARIKVAYGGLAGGQEGEETFHSQPLKLEVRDAMALEHEWRPLQWLDLRTELDGDAPRVGKPIILSVDIRARGTRGDELPSIATQLAVPGFKVYPERPRVDTRVQQPGHIWGRRVESYTVIPTRDGLLEIPEIVVHWWDLTGKRPVTERVPAQELKVLPALARSGVVMPQEQAPAKSPADGVGSFALMVLLAIAGGYGLFWLLGDAGGGELRFQRLRRLAASRYAAGVAALAALWRRLRWGVIRFLDRSLPFAAHYWWWRRQVRRAPDASGLRRMLRSLAAVRLEAAPHATLDHLGDRLAAGAPEDEAEVIRHLMHQLDDEYYGRHDMDVAQWKDEWALVLGGCLSRTRRVRPRPGPAAEPRRQLPELNP